MLKLFSLGFLFFLSCDGTIIRTPLKYDRDFLYDKNLLNIENQEIVKKEYDIETLKWQAHMLDFLKLIDLEKLINTAVRFVDDPEVMKFVEFLLSPKFKEIVWEIETLEEFKEACMFLEAKGYDVESIINFVNSALNLLPFSASEPLSRFNAGVNGFIAAMIGSLPVEDMKKLLNNKLENSPEVINLFQVLNSPEFADIVRRMVDNPKFSEMKSIFESYGVDFNFMCLIVEEIIGENYQGTFCKKNESFAVLSK